MKFKLLVLLLATSYVLLAIYSFSHLDLNLTLSTNPIYQSFQKQLTYLGYFNRPLSTIIYLSLIFLLTTCYLILTTLAKKNLISHRQTWLTIFLITLILLFSYPAFSHDIFNYMFDARIVTKYGLSPWEYKALDFPVDTWTRFMRWTHRPSVYPPVWIGISLLPSLLGFGKFTLTLGLFKLFAAAAYLGCCKLISKLNQKALVLFAFNPLVIIETLVNGHMEIIMVFFGLLAIYLTLQHRRFLSWVSFIGSVGIKYMTVYLTPILLKGDKWLRRTVWLGLILTTVWIIYYGFQPWYGLWILPFAYLLPIKSWEVKLLTLFSLAAPFWNLPLVSFGDFRLPDPTNRLFIYVFMPFIFLSGIYATGLVIKPKS